MQAENISQKTWMMHCGLIELLISPLLECLHTELSLVSNVANKKAAL